MGLEEIRRLKEQANQPKVVKKYVIPKKSAKKIEQEKTQITVVIKPKKAGWFDINNVDTEIEKTKTDLQQWFEDRHKEMKGVCQHCGGKTQKGKENYKNSIAHIFPKAYFKSIATHPLNSIELCFYNNSCHTNYDNNMLDLTELNCFDEVIEKFCKMYPYIDKNERRRIPKVLLEYVETNK